MRGRTIASLFVLMLAAPAGGAQRYVVDGRWREPSAKLEWSDLVTVSVAGGQLRVRMQPTPRGEQVVRGSRAALIELGGTPLLWYLNAAGRGWDVDGVTPTQQMQLSVKAGEMPTVDGVYPTSLQITPAFVRLAGTGLVDGELITTEVVINSSTGKTIINFGPANGPKRRSLPADDLLALLQRHPRETYSYVAPLLRVLSEGRNPLAPQAGDVYTAFPEIPAAADGKARLDRILEGLSSPDPVVREAAAKRLGQGDSEIVLAACRVDRDALPPEERVRLGQFIQSRKLYPRTSASQYAGDTHFLVECLADRDLAVREAAKNALGPVLGEAANVNVSQIPERRALDRLHDLAGDRSGG
jgi:hypothetical protein